MTLAALPSTLNARVCLPQQAKGIRKPPSTVVCCSHAESNSSRRGFVGGGLAALLLSPACEVLALPLAPLGKSGTHVGGDKLTQQPIEAIKVLLQPIIGFPL